MTQVEQGKELLENTADKTQPDVKWYDVAQYEGRLINAEKAYAILLEKPFDPKYRTYAFGGSSLVMEEDGSFSKENSKRCPAMSLNVVTTLVEYLKETADTEVTFGTAKDLPFDINLFYDEKHEINELIETCPKIVVTFKDSEVDKIFAINMTSKFQYKLTLITIAGMFAQKANEIDRNGLIQNLFLALQNTGNQGRTKGGLIVPK